MTDEVSRSEVITRRFELDEQISLIEARHKAELAPLEDEPSLCEKFVADSMNKANEQSVKIDGVGMTFFTTQDSVRVGDWDAVLAYIVENKAYELLNHAVSKSTVKEILEAKNPLPPGVTYEARKVLAWRRGKA